jgi:hypothetical protein
MGISVECVHCYYTDLTGTRQNTYGTSLTNKEMKTDSFLRNLNSKENVWIHDKEPYINSGYPVLSSIKCKGVFTNEATDITEETAILQGNFIIKNEKVLQRGFEYKAKDSTQSITVFVDSELFSYTLTHLISNKEYEFMAFVVTDKGKMTGRNIVFRTLDAHSHHHDHHHILDHKH